MTIGDNVLQRAGGADRIAAGGIGAALRAALAGGDAP
jgi:hypothetical protein